MARSIVFIFHQKLSRGSGPIQIACGLSSGIHKKIRTQDEKDSPRRWTTWKKNITPHDSNKPDQWNGWSSQEIDRAFPPSPGPTSTGCILAGMPPLSWQKTSQPGKT